MKTIIAVEKIDITSLMDNRILEVGSRNEKRVKEREDRIKILTPYIAQALFGMVEIHNKLVQIESNRRIFNLRTIEDAHTFVNDFVNNDANWNHKEVHIQNESYKNVSFKLASLHIWLSDNYGYMNYTKNPVYQIYGSYDVEGFLKSLIQELFN
jgi:hypothetical protein